MSSSSSSNPSSTPDVKPVLQPVANQRAQNLGFVVHPGFPSNAPAPPPQQAPQALAAANGGYVIHPGFPNNAPAPAAPRAPAVSAAANHRYVNHPGFPHNAPAPPPQAPTLPPGWFHGFYNGPNNYMPAAPMNQLPGIGVFSHGNYHNPHYAAPLQHYGNVNGGNAPPPGPRRPTTLEECVDMVYRITPRAGTRRDVEEWGAKLLAAIPMEPTVTSKGICAICRMPAIGVRYSVPSCEKCARFFLRTSYLAPEKVKCSGNARCVSLGTYSCTKCRFEKCKRAGMKLTPKGKVDVKPMIKK